MKKIRSGACCARREYQIPEENKKWIKTFAFIVYIPPAPAHPRYGNKRSIFHFRSANILDISWENNFWNQWIAQIFTGWLNSVLVGNFPTELAGEKTGCEWENIAIGAVEHGSSEICG